MSFLGVITVCTALANASQENQMCSQVGQKQYDDFEECRVDVSLRARMMIVADEAVPVPDITPGQTKRVIYILECVYVSS